MEDYEIKDKILAYLCKYKNPVFTLLEIRKAIGLSDQLQDRVKTLLGELVKAGHVQLFPHENYFGAKSDGCSFLENKGGYTRQEKKKNRPRNKWDRRREWALAILVLILAALNVLQYIQYNY